MNTDSVQKFPLVKKGYDPEAVDVYIENLGEKNQFLQERIVELEKRISLAEELIETFSKAEDELRQNIADSKKAAAAMILDARQRAASLLEQARAECGKMVSRLDQEIANRLQVLDVLKAQANAFKDQLFDLYGNHIELIESIASAAQAHTYTPDYEGIAQAVNAFEEAGEPEADIPAFTEYPKDSIFAEAKEISLPAKEAGKAQDAEAAPPAEDGTQAGLEEEDDFFAPNQAEAEKETVYPFETESVFTTTEETDYHKYLEDFANGDKDEE